jgi:hypothetical protein
MFTIHHMFITFVKSRAERTHKMNESIQAMARHVCRTIDAGGGPCAPLAEIKRLHGRAVTRAVFEEVMRRQAFEMQEA